MAIHLKCKVYEVPIRLLIPISFLHLLRKLIEIITSLFS